LQQVTTRCESGDVLALVPRPKHPSYIETSNEIAHIAFVGLRIGPHHGPGRRPASATAGRVDW
jgi:hypothetical protein